MKIALVAPFEESIPPKKYGGTELVVYNIVQELVRLKHNVTLLATGDSKVNSKLVSIFKQNIRSIPEAKNLEIRNSLKYMGVGKIVEYFKNNKFDIIHNHLGWRLLSFEHTFNCPVVTTLHGPLGIPYQQFVYNAYSKSNYVSISLNQRKPMPKLNFVGNVYNGIDLSKFKFFQKPKDYFAFLGRMSPEKGPVQAISAAKKAGVKLIMAAKVDAVDKEYFDKEVKPLIDGNQIKFIGEVDHKGKLELLGNARGLLALIQWEEPFGLFFVEAMACGTPVIAMGRGSVPEIVKNKQTGFICRNNLDIDRAIKNIDSIDRKTCFNHVNENFSTQKMVKDYLEVYKKVIKNYRSK